MIHFLGITMKVVPLEGGAGRGGAHGRTGQQEDQCTSQHQHSDHGKVSQLDAVFQM